MKLPVYWYTARIIIGRDSQKVVFKSDFPDYVPGDQIVKRYKMGRLYVSASFRATGRKSRLTL